MEPWYKVATPRREVREGRPPVRPGPSAASTKEREEK